MGWRIDCLQLVSAARLAHLIPHLYVGDMRTACGTSRPGLQTAPQPKWVTPTARKGWLAVPNRVSAATAPFAGSCIVVCKIIASSTACRCVDKDAQPNQSAPLFSDNPQPDNENGTEGHLLADNAELPAATHAKVHTAEYIQSSVDWQQCPAINFPEFAVIGRSNVGKSSLINLLTGQQDLAMTSKQPGKTRCINHFLVNGNSSKPWYLVDLPGYGYAARAKTEREDFDDFTRAFFLNRSSLAIVFLLVDASIAPQDLDIEYACWLSKNSIPFSLVFTKTDKSKKRQDGHARVEENVEAFKNCFLKKCSVLPVCHETSARLATGRIPLLQYIARLRASKERGLPGRQVAEGPSKRQLEQVRKYEEAKRRQLAATAGGPGSTSLVVEGRSGGGNITEARKTDKLVPAPAQRAGSTQASRTKGPIARGQPAKQTRRVQVKAFLNTHG